MIMKIVFKKQGQNPKALMRIGLAFLALSAAWPRLIPFTGHVDTDLVDGIKGLLLGLAIGFIVWASRVGGFRPGATKR
jgi:hypothetical protein